MIIQTLHVTGHAIDGFARHDGFFRVSRHVNWVVQLQEGTPDGGGVGTAATVDRLGTG